MRLGTKRMGIENVSYMMLTVDEEKSTYMFYNDDDLKAFVESRSKNYHIDYNI